MELKELKGVGPQTLKKLQSAGIETVDDLLHWYPRDYMTYEPAVPICELNEEKKVTIHGHFINSPITRRFRNQQITTGSFSDGTGRITVNWYHMPYITSAVIGGEIYLRGKVMKKGRQWILYQPSILKEEDYFKLLNSLMPIYPLKTGITNKLIISLVAQCLEKTELTCEYLPLSFRKKYQLAEANYAMHAIHFPEDEHDRVLARKRLVFDEFFFFMLSVRELKEQKQKSRNVFQFLIKEAGNKLEAGLPYQLTGAQKRTMDEIYRDMHSDHVMNRLIQGDVGSGKTIVALLAMIHAAENGYQSALMAPTEVLAQQHYESFTKLFHQYGLDFRVILLTGSMTARQKRLAYEKIAAHEADIIIGTHALIQENVIYDNLALVVTDEQHRFGVRQRAIFAQKAEDIKNQIIKKEEKGTEVSEKQREEQNAVFSKRPHVLVMSATPIPRTLALILYGDLDISVMDELPANRIPIKNCVVDKSYLPKAYSFIEKEIQKGRQAYVICPMVEESEQVEGENVTDYTEQLQQVLSSEIKVGCLHGKMKPKEKNEIMNAFAAHELDVLVSTTVVEVGVNVPNATVMMIENAERFGLSQLHQLRGRVGRGRYQSYCIFMDRSGNKQKSERLTVLEKSNDGFFIASEDLRLRGPGDFYGVRQNGQLQFALADIYTDAAVMKQAKEAADDIYEGNAEMTDDESHRLKELLEIYQKQANAAEVPL